MGHVRLMSRPREEMLRFETGLVGSDGRMD